jgi:hypothetical protein
MVIRHLRIEQFGVEVVAVTCDDAVELTGVEFYALACLEDVLDKY